MKEYICIESPNEVYGGMLMRKQTLIRCEDCRYFAMLEDASNETVCDHKDGCLRPTPDGFCNYAEPKRKAKT